MGIGRVGVWLSHIKLAVAKHFHPSRVPAAGLGESGGRVVMSQSEWLGFIHSMPEDERTQFRKGKRSMATKPKFFLRRHETSKSPGLKYWYEIIERVKPHALAVEGERSVCTLLSEEAGSAVVDELNRQFREGVIAGMRRFAWWADGEEFVGTCGTRLKDAVAEVERDG
jgi:hypothetical protein